MGDVISPRSKHKLDPADMSRGGKKSKRGPSVKRIWQELIDQEIPPAVRKALKEKQVVLPNGKTVALDMAPLDKNVGKAIALAVLTEALAREPWAAKLVVEMVDGKAAQPITGSDEHPPLTVATAELSDAATKKIEQVLFEELNKG